MSERQLSLLLRREPAEDDAPRSTVSRPGKVFLAMVSRPFLITTFRGQPPRKMPAERMQEPTLVSSFSRARSIVFLYAASSSSSLSPRDQRARGCTQRPA